jgi:hypothetical protein
VFRLLTFILGAAGCGKTMALLHQLKEDHGVKKYKRFVLIVPKVYCEITENQLSGLVGNEPLLNVEVISFKRFLQAIAADFGGVVLSKAKERILLFSAIEKVKPQLMNFKHLDSFEVLQEIVSKINLHESDGSHVVSESCDVALILKTFDEFLAVNGCLSEQILLKKIKNLIWLKETGFYLDSFFCFSEFEFEMLKILIEKTDVLITLPMPYKIDCGGNAVLKKISQTLIELNQVAEKLGAVVFKRILKEPKRFVCKELKYFAENFFRGGLKPFDEVAEKIAIVNSKNKHEELQFVAAVIWKLIEEEGHSFDDFLILVPDISIYQEPIKSQFFRYQIDCFWDMKKKRVCIFSQFITAFFRVLNTGFETEAVIEFAKSPFFAADKLILGTFEAYARAQQISGDVWIAPFLTFGVWQEELNLFKNRVLTPLFEIVGAETSTGFEFAKRVFRYLEEVVVAKLASVQIDSQRQEIGRYEAFINLLDDFVEVLGSQIATAAAKKLLAWCWQKIDYVVIRKKTNQVTVSLLGKMGGWPESKVVFILDGVLNDWRKFSKAVSENLTQEDAESLLVLRALTAAKERVFVCLPNVPKILCGSDMFFLERLQKFFSGIKLQAPFEFLQFADFIRTPHTVVDLLCGDFKLQEKKLFFRFLGPEFLRKISWQNPGCEKCVPRATKFSFVQVEDYFRCGFWFFCRHILKLIPTLSNTEMASCSIDGILQRVCTGLLVSCFGNGDLKRQEKLNYVGRQKFFDIVADEKRLEKWVTAAVQIEFRRFEFVSSKWLFFLQSETVLLTMELLRSIAVEMKKTQFIPFAFGVKISKRFPCREKIIELYDEIGRVDFLQCNGELKVRSETLQLPFGGRQRGMCKSWRQAEIERVVAEVRMKGNPLKKRECEVGDVLFTEFAKSIGSAGFGAQKGSDCRICEYFLICGNVCISQDKE